MPGMIRLISSQAARSPLKKMVGMSYIPALKALIPASPIGVPLRVRDRMFLLLKVWAKAAPGVPFIACWPIIRKASKGPSSIPNIGSKGLPHDQLGFPVQQLDVDASWTVAVANDDLVVSGAQDPFDGGVDLQRGQPHGFFVMDASGAAIFLIVDDAADA